MDFTDLLNSVSGTFNPNDIYQYYTWFDSSTGQFRDLSGLTSQVNSLWLTIATIAGLILSLVCCFYGYRLSKHLMSLSGFIVGSYLGRSLIIPMTGLKGIAAYLITLLCGFLLASAAWKIYKLGLCLLAFFLTWSAAQILIPMTGPAKLVLCLFLSVCAGALILAFLRPGIILLTAVFGGSHASAGLLTAASYLHIKIPPVFSGILPLSTGLVAAGIIVQLITTRHDK